MKTALLLPVAALGLALAWAAPSFAVTFYADNSCPTGGDVLFSDCFGTPLLTSGPVNLQGSGDPGAWTVTGTSKITKNSFAQGNGMTTNNLPYYKSGEHAGDTSDSTQYASLVGQHTTITSTSISTNGATNLDLSFLYAAYRTEAADTLTVIASDGSTTTLALGPPDDGEGGANHDDGLQWTAKDISLLLGSGVTSIVLQFTANTSEAGSEIAYLDDIVLTAVPVPAAFSFGAAGLGLLGLLAWRGKRKRNEAMAAC